MLGRFWVATGVPCVATVFASCRDRGFLSRPRWSRQEVGVAIEPG